jgi:arginyl-tRNA synthetase
MGEAFLAAGIPADVPVMIALPARPEFGDYQANGVMAAAKRMGANPRQLAAKVVEAAGPILADLADKVEVAGPGFINIHLRAEWLSSELTARLGDDRLGVPAPAAPQTVVVDYSAPNIAKEMHVGHLRSSIIGDALARVLDFIGHKVIRQNHIGDWGRQFGVVILGLWHICMSRKRQKTGEPDYIASEGPRLALCKPGEKATYDLLKSIRDRHEADWEADSKEDRGDGELCFRRFLDRFLASPKSVGLGELLHAYKFVTAIEDLSKGTDLDIPTRWKDQNEHWQFRRDPYCQLSRHIAAMLQDYENWDKDNKQEWDAWIVAKNVTIEECTEVYSRLGVLLEPSDIRGESDYMRDLREVVADLEKSPLFRPSEGAKCVFPPGFLNKDGQELPLIVQKSNEGYLYATTDLAAIRYRCGTGPSSPSWAPADRILYVVDARQSLHFQMLFAVAKDPTVNFAPPGVSLEHIGFGTVLGEDGRPLKTRSGELIKLRELLDEAQQRAMAFVSEKNPDLPEDQRKQIARAVGIGAVKYADLSQNRSSDYVFSWDKMLSLDGNTAPYMQYAYARVRSIFRKDKTEALKSAGPLGIRGVVSIEAPAERVLGLKLAQFPETIEAVARDCLPSVLCAYLYDLAGAFMGFYESCPVLKAGDDGTRASRLLLCELTARTIQTGLNLLGIDTIEQM